MHGESFQTVCKYDGINLNDNSGQRSRMAFWEPLVSSGGGISCDGGREFYGPLMVQLRATNAS